MSQGNLEREAAGVFWT